MTVIEQKTLEAVQSAARKYASSQVDWEQRRYEIAKEIYIRRLVNKDIEHDMEESAIRYADSLIAKLQERYGR